MAARPSPLSAQSTTAAPLLLLVEMTRVRAPHQMQPQPTISRRSTMSPSMPERGEDSAWTSALDMVSVPIWLGVAE